MSRVSLLEKLYMKPRSINALEFRYENLYAPPIRSLFMPEDLNELYRIATSVKLSGNIDYKYELIDQVMTRRGFRFDHRGTNRASYRYLENTTFIAKVAIDKAGMKDSPAEYRNQEYLKPFCCKIFEVDPTGVLAFVEKVNPITSLEEFASVADDIFNMMITKVIGKYVVDDLGTTKFMNYGIRMCNGHSFGPVIIDFPYVYNLDGAKLVCKNIDPITNKICFGEIDYDAGLNNLICTKCGKKYAAQDLKKDDTTIIKMYKDIYSERSLPMRARIVNGNGDVIYDSGRVSEKNLTAEQIQQMQFIDGEVPETTEVFKTIVSKRSKETPLDVNRRVYNEQREKYMIDMNNQRAQDDQFNPVIKRPDDSNVQIVNKTVSASSAITDETMHNIIPELDNPPIEDIEVVVSSEKEEISDMTEEEPEEEIIETGADLPEDYVDPMTEYYNNLKKSKEAVAEPEEDSYDDEDDYDKYAEYEDQFSNGRGRRSKPKGGKKFRPSNEDMSDF